MKNHYDNYPECFNNTPCKCVLPEKGKNFIEFQHYNYKFRCPFVIYADFEAILKPYHDENDETITHKHIICGYGFQMISAIDEKHNTSSFYRGEDAINVFLKNILKVKDYIMSMIHDEKSMIFNTEDKIKFDNAKVCHICEKDFGRNKFNKCDKVRDHCHFTGKYLGAAHYQCNINRNYKKF